MNRNRTVGRVAGCLVLAAVTTAFTARAQASSCDWLTRLQLTATRIVAADVNGPGGEGGAELAIPAPGVRYCRVQAIIEKEIGVEVWLPEPQAWNGRLLVVGVGGQAGQFNYRELARGLRRGYATASTDTGHKAGDTHWLLGDPMRAANYAYRANHLLADKLKNISKSYYKREAQHAFFIGCSGGGRQALTEVQRFPRDFDGVIAGAPGPKTPEMSARRMWEMVQHSRHAGLMSEADWHLLADAAVKKCDALDGVSDGVLENPTQCRYDIAALTCAGRKTSECLAAEQVQFARVIYGPLSDENGRQIDDGLLPGVLVTAVPAPEPFTPGPPYLAVALFGDGVHKDINWDPMSFRLSSDLPAIDRVMDLHADHADLNEFKSHGGKLIIYQGWGDPLVAAQQTVAYVQAVRQAMTDARTDSFLRLFMVPGMGHCSGGNATDHFGGMGGDAPMVDPEHDLLSALEYWTQSGHAPQQIVASKLESGRVVRTRPLCAYPAQSHYLGIGNTDDAASFKCDAPRNVLAIY